MGEMTSTAYRSPRFAARSIPELPLHAVHHCWSTRHLSEGLGLPGALRLTPNDPN